MTPHSIYHQSIGQLAVVLAYWIQQDQREDGEPFVSALHHCLRQLNEDVERAIRQLLPDQAPSPPRKTGPRPRNRARWGNE